LYLKTEEGTLQSSSSRRNLSIVEVKEHVASVKSFEVLRVLCLAFSPLLEAQFKSRIVLSSFGWLFAEEYTQLCDGILPESIQQ
jgi:hypothetical protein